jgi:hypothetical protein
MSAAATVSLVRGSFHVVPQYHVSLDATMGLSTDDMAATATADPRWDDADDSLMIQSPVLKPRPRVTRNVREFESYTKNINGVATSGHAADAPPGLPLRRCSFGVDLREGTSSPTSSIAFLDLGATKDIALLLDDDVDATAPEPQLKQVRFQIDRSGEIYEQVTVQSFAKHQLTTEDISNGWYSRMELRQMKADVPLECRELLQGLPHYYQAAVDVCTVAARANDYESTLTEHIDSLLRVVDGEVRGLERPLLYRLNLPRSPCKRIAAAVLSTQATIRTLATEEDTEEEIAALIAKQYRYNCKYAVRWALILAAGDELEAREYCLLV